MTVVELIDQLNDLPPTANVNVQLPSADVFPLDSVNLVEQTVLLVADDTSPENEVE
jgi:hypothetical protein